MSDSTLISEMRGRLRHSESLIALLKKSTQADDLSIGELNARLVISERERVAETQALRAGVRDARRLIGNAQAQTAALKAEARVAMNESYAAATDSARVAHIVQVTDAQTRSRLSDALTTARAAAAKAGVFRVPEPILQQMISYLRASPSGSSSVACAPGLEAACGDLASAFKRSGWQPAFVARGASFFTGAGEDAVADANQDAGLIIWCRLLRKPLARSLAGTLEPAGFDVDVRIVPDNPSETDIGISVRFVRPAP